MSWDVGLYKFSRRYDKVADVPDDETTLLGDAAAVRERIDQVFPDIDWSDPGWGNWLSALGSIEFNMSDNAVIESIALHVRAEDAVVAAIVELCRANGWQAIDYSSGEFIEQSDQPAAGLAAWRAFRDQLFRDPR